ncbi:MAG: transcription termination factor NusA [Candidatus Eremiobacterota bacterium]
MSNELIKALEQIEKEKGISKLILLEAIKDALSSALKRNFGNTQNFTIEIDQYTGNVRVLARKKVVTKVTDPHSEVLHRSALQTCPDCQPGDMIEVEITPSNVGRIAAQTAKQVIVQRIREAERDLLFKEFADRKGDIVTGVIQRIEQNKVYIDLAKIEGVIPQSEQVVIEKYRPGDRIKVYILDVKVTSKGPQVILSRTHPGFLNRLFEMEVPEIYEHIVDIKSTAREPGYRSKIAVHSSNSDVDAVGSCVGSRGSRVLSVVQELKGEKIDIVLWDKDPVVFIANALNPAKVLSVELREEDNFALVVVPDNQLSLAIGKEGQNARLGAKLTGWKIDIKNKSAYEEEQAKNKIIDELIGSLVEGFKPVVVMAVEVLEKEKTFLFTITFEHYIDALERKKSLLLTPPYEDWFIRVKPPLDGEFPMEEVAGLLMKLLAPVPIISLELNKKDKKLFVGISSEYSEEILKRQEEEEFLARLGDWKIVIEPVKKEEYEKEHDDIIDTLVNIISPVSVVSLEVDEEKHSVKILVAENDLESAGEKMNKTKLPDFMSNWQINIEPYSVLNGGGE